jgi:hypothetical protein
MKQTTTRKFREHFLEKYPNLQYNSNYRYFLNYIMFGPATDGAKLISYMTLAICANKVNEAESGHFDATSFLKSFKKDILPKFNWNGHIRPGEYGEGMDGKCRTIGITGLDSEDFKLINEEIKKPGEVYFVSGKTNNPSNKKENMKIDRFINYTKNINFIFGLNQTQKKIYDVISHSGVEFSNIFTEKLRENYQYVIKEIESITPSHDDVEDIVSKKIGQYKTIGSINDDPRIFYKPSENNRTPRLHHANDCVISLKSNVRKALCKGLVDIDLVSSQFIILSNLLKAKSSIELIKSNKNIWNYLLESSGYDVALNPDMKKRLKQIVYGLCFGKSKNNLKNDCDMLGLSKVYNNLIIQELLEKRSEWFSNIKETGYVTDVWNNRLETSNDRWEGSVAASKIQSIEMEVISSVIDTYNSCGDCYRWKILIWQHDGFTAKFCDSYKERVKSRLQDDLSYNATELGKKIGIDLSDMRLEFSDL